MGKELLRAPAQENTPWTIGRILEWTTQYLRADNQAVSTSRLEAQLLLAHALNCSRTELYTRYDEQPTEAQRSLLRDLVRQRAQGCPVAYLLGRKEFFSLEFEVNPDVLIPRPDSEWLVAETLELIKEISEPRLIDIGTGSGCLAIALAKRHPTARLTAVDRCDKALAVARRNAEKHQVADRIQFLQGDLFDSVPSGARFHVIFSNPPYIATAQIATLDKDVRLHEPMLALDGGCDGFAVLGPLMEKAPPFLEDQGWLIWEIGSDQEEESRTRIEKAGGWELAKTVADGAGHPRVMKARRR